MTSADAVHEVLRRSILVEGFPFVLDMDGSHGQYLRDAKTGAEYLDFFTFYASRPVAFNHPRLREPDYLAKIQRAASCKPSNCDVYTPAFADFVETFRTRALGPQMKHLFFIDGGALAVENALKAAFDWKVQKNMEKGIADKGGQVIHFRHAFHGRSGYTLSMTNTSDQRKIRYFPKFDWPRISSPAQHFPIDDASTMDVERREAEALAEIDRAYDRVGADDIACIIIEPVQCEGGDRHFRPSFFKALRKICDEREALLVFDEVQTGMGTTGAWWAYEQLGVVPDVVAFAKRAQTGGIMAGARLDEVKSVFHEKSRISSTFAGNLVDFVRAQRYIEIADEEGLLANAAAQGAAFLTDLSAMATRVPEMDNVRGRGLLIAFDLPTTEARNAAVLACRTSGLLVLSCGDRSLRLRPALDVSDEDRQKGLQILEKVLLQARIAQPA